jgi:hypothetical protein
MNDKMVNGVVGGAVVEVDRRESVSKGCDVFYPFSWLPLMSTRTCCGASIEVATELFVRKVHRITAIVCTRAKRSSRNYLRYQFNVNVMTVNNTQNYVYLYLPCKFFSGNSLPKFLSCM